MIGKLDKEIIAKFQEFQEKTGKHRELYIEDVEFENKSVRNIFNTVRRGASPRPIKEFIVDNNYSEKKYNWLKIGDVTRSNIYLKKTSQYINEDGKNKSVLGKKGDFLVTNSMTVGVPIILDIDTCFHDGFLYLGFDDRKQKDFSSLYLYYFFTSFREKLILKSKDGIVKNLNTDIMKEVEISIPKDLNKFYSSYQIQEAIVEFLEFWKDQYTDIFRINVFKKKSIYKNIRKIVVKNTFKYDNFLVERFNWFAKKNKYKIAFEDLKFEAFDLFNDLDNIQLIGSKKIGSHDELEQIYDKNALPVYDASASILTYIQEDKFPNAVFEVENNNNPDISFATEGNSSAGTNFIIHKDKYFVNNHRMVIKFSDKYYGKYIYYNLLKMKDQYGFKRGYIPSQQELKKLKIMVMIPKKNLHYSSFEQQNILVHFWEDIIGQIDRQLKIYNRMLEVTDIIDKAFLHRTFSKIEWSSNE